MDRRRSRRWPRHLDVRLRKPGEERQVVAIATNISRTGMFVRTPQVAPSGTRFRVEVVHASGGFVVETVVTRAIRTPPQMQAMRPSGMGLRFVGIEKLLEDLFPGMTSPGETEQIPAAEAEAEARAIGSAPAAPAPAAAPLPTPAPTNPPYRLFRISFNSREHFRRVFEEDIATGGLFVPSPHPRNLDEVIVVEISLDDVDCQPVRVEGRVVHRLDPPPSEALEVSLLAGMGVQFTDIPATIERLRSLLEG